MGGTGRTATDFAGVFATLKPALAGQAARLAVKNDSLKEYTLVTKAPSPYPQHKGQPIAKTVSPQLKKHMQGKTCFNFKVPPSPEVLEELRRLTNAAADHWDGQQFL